MLQFWVLLIWVTRCICCLVPEIRPIAKGQPSDGQFAALEVHSCSLYTAVIAIKHVYHFCNKVENQCLSQWNLNLIDIETCDYNGSCNLTINFELNQFNHWNYPKIWSLISLLGPLTLEVLMVSRNIEEYRGKTSVILDYNKSSIVFPKSQCISVVPKQERETGIEKKIFAHA